MRIQSEDKRSWIDLTLRDAAPEEYASGDRALSMAVNSSGFAGAEQQVWFGVDAIARFLTELDALETGSANRATLFSMDAEVAAAGSDSVVANQLVLHRLDELGQFAVRIILGRPTRLPNGARLMVEAAFEIDRTSKRSMFMELRSMFA